MNEKRAQIGYERDLQNAELALLASGNNPTAYATALRDYFAAHRNYTNGAMVPMFVEMVERVLDDKLSPVVAGIGGLQVSIAYLNNEFQLLRDIVNTLARDMIESKLDRVEIHNQLNAVKALVVQLQNDFNTYSASNRRNELDILKTQVAALYKATHHDNQDTE